MQHDFVDYDFAIEDPGYFRLPGVSYRWGDYTLRTLIGGGHGRTDLQKAIYQSCDTFFYDLGNRMGIDTIHGFMSQFGFGQNFALISLTLEQAFFHQRTGKRRVEASLGIRATLLTLRLDKDTCGRLLYS